MSSSKSDPKFRDPSQDDEGKISLDSNEDIIDDSVVEAMASDVDSVIEELDEADDPVQPPTEPEPAGPAEASTPEEPALTPDTNAAEPEPQSSPEQPEDQDIEEAVEDIAASGEDLSVDESDAPPKRELKAQKPQSEIAIFIKKLWNNPKSRWGILGGTAGLLLVLALIPNTRYFILNTARVRSSVEVRVIDNSTLQPLKNVTVRAANASAQTDSDGVAKLEKVLLGKTKLKIEKRAYAHQEKTITVGWGSNPLGEYQVVPIGSQYTFHIRDYFSGKPISRAEASSGEGNASSDEEGKIVLSLDTATLDDSAQVSVDITAAGYRNEKINITVNNKEAQSIEMVPARKHVFVSKRSGNYDVYSVDADGKNERRIVGGSGYERDDISLVPHHSENYAAYVATRENTRNQNGYLLSTLYILDVDSGDLMRIDQSEQIQVIGWSKSGRLVYVKIAAGASGTDPKRHRLMSFNNEDHSDTKELASSNSFNDIIMAADKVYYAPSNIFQEIEPATYVSDPDGKNNQKILDKETSSIIRTSYDTLHLISGNDWHEYTIGSPMAASTNPPGSQVNRLYMDNKSGSISMWIDERDGKGVLIARQQGSSDETVIHERGGMKSPLYWLNDKYIIFRVADGRETADYILNTEGGEPRKIVDTTDTSGISRWIYY